MKLIGSAIGYGMAAIMLLPMAPYVAVMPMNIATSNDLALKWMPYCCHCYNNLGTQDLIVMS